MANTTGCGKFRGWDSPGTGMKLFAATIRSSAPAGRALVRLSPEGRVAETVPLDSSADLPARIASAAGEEPFSLALDVPVVVPPESKKQRPFESVVRRRLGHKLPPGGRAAAGDESVAPLGESLLAGLSTAGRPALPHPDRDRRRDGLAEIDPGLCLHALLWESSTALWGSGDGKEELFRAFRAPAFRAEDGRKRPWTERAVALDLTLRGLLGMDGFDTEAARLALTGARDDESTERAAAVLDASVMAGTLRRYLESPERSLFLGDRETGYVILPADGVVRRLALRDRKRSASEAETTLFPRRSLEERLGAHAELHALELLAVDESPRRIEARFHDGSHPVYRFENVDEMLWWKHCRHVEGPALPTEGLEEMKILLIDDDRSTPSSHPLSLSRSRHKTLSFRFDAPNRWREHMSTRDGRSYTMRILRTVHRTVA